MGRKANKKSALLQQPARSVKYDKVYWNQQLKTNINTVVIVEVIEEKMKAKIVKEYITSGNINEWVIEWIRREMKWINPHNTWERERFE